MAENFESALQRFRSFVQENGYAGELAWLTPPQVSARPGVLYIRLAGANLGEESARQVFDKAAAQDRGVLFHALFSNDGVTLCHAWLPLNDDEAERYLMPQKGLKMSVHVGEHRPRVYTVRSRIRWFLLRLLYRRYDALRDLLFNIEH